MLGLRFRLLDLIWSPPFVSKQQTLADDGIPWRLDAPRRVVAIGDLQGDFTAAVSILQEVHLIDRAGHWCGGDAVLVLVGDVVRGHRDSLLLLEFVIQLEREAGAAGGAVHALLGNHDVLCLERKHPFAGAELRFFKKSGRRPPRREFRHGGHYADWWQSRNTMLLVGDTLFVHAGIDGSLVKHTPGRVNATARAWVRFLQGSGPRPPAKTRWIIGDPRERGRGAPAAGPLWTRAFKVQGRGRKRGADAMSADELQAALGSVGASRVVVGHSPVPKSRIVTDHPEYGPLVVMVDTGICRNKDGRLSALEIHDGDLIVHYPEMLPQAKELRRAWLEQIDAWKTPVAPGSA